MPDINIKRFGVALDVLCLFAESQNQYVTVVETDRTIAFRPFLRQSSVGLVIPKARSRGMSYTRHETVTDDSDGTEIGTFTNIHDVKRLLRSVRHQARRGESPGWVSLDIEPGTVTLTVNGPGGQLPIIAHVGWTSIPPTLRTPVYLTGGSGGDRVSASVLNAMGQAGRKISPTSFWSHQDGRWVFTDSSGTTLRVATWPTTT